MKPEEEVAMEEERERRPPSLLVCKRADQQMGVAMLQVKTLRSNLCKKVSDSVDLNAQLSLVYDSS